MRLPAAVRATLTACRRSRTHPHAPEPDRGPGLKPELTASDQLTVQVWSRVSSEALTEAATAVLGAMREVDSTDASRLLFDVARAIGEVAVERDAAWVVFWAEELAAEAAGEPPCN